jgi:hypothetical protein
VSNAACAACAASPAKHRQHTASVQVLGVRMQRWACLRLEGGRQRQHPEQLVRPRRAAHLYRRKAVPCHRRLHAHRTCRWRQAAAATTGRKAGRGGKGGGTNGASRPGGGHARGWQSTAGLCPPGPPTSTHLQGHPHLTHPHPPPLTPPPPTSHNPTSHHTSTHLHAGGGGCPQQVVVLGPGVHEHLPHCHRLVAAVV